MSRRPVSCADAGSAGGVAGVMGVDDASGNTLFTTSFAPGNTPYGWSGGQRVIGAIVPPWQSALSTVKSPTGGSPAPIQPHVARTPTAA